MSASAQGLCEFIDASPSPFHVCVTVAQRLSAAGFTELSERDEWPGEGRFFTVRAGSLVAWRSDEACRRAFSDRRRPHRQPQSAGQAAPRSVRLRLAGGRSAALRRGLAELVAGPRSRHQWPAVGTLRRRRHHRPPAGARSTSRSCACRSWRSTWPRTASRSRSIRSGTSTRSGALAAAPGRFSATSPSARVSMRPTSSAPT